MNSPSLADKQSAQCASPNSNPAYSLSTSRLRGNSASTVSRTGSSAKLATLDWKELKHIPPTPPPIIIERQTSKKSSSTTSSVPIQGLFYFYQTIESTSLVEVLHKKKSEVVGSANSTVIYWKKSKSLVLDEGALYKISLKDMKKTRFGVELSRVGLHGLKHFQTLILKEKLYIIGGLREGKPSAECFEIDLKNRTVFNTPPLPFLQSGQLLVASDKNLFYCFGEVEAKSEGSAAPDKAKSLAHSPGACYSLFSYCPDSKTWTVLAELSAEPSQPANVAHKSSTASASSRSLRPNTAPESLPFSPGYLVNDKHFLLVVDRHNPALVAKYFMAENKWVKDLLKEGKQLDLGRFDTVCMANHGKHTLLGAAVSNTSDVDILSLDLLTNKTLKYTQLSVLDTMLPIVLVPLYKIHY